MKYLYCIDFQRTDLVSSGVGFLALAGETNVSVGNTTAFRPGDVILLADLDGEQEYVIDDVGGSWMSVEQPLARSFSEPAEACLVSTLLGSSHCPFSGTKCAILKENAAAGDDFVTTYRDSLFLVGENVVITDKFNADYTTIVSMGSIGLAADLAKGYAKGFCYLVALPDISAASADGGYPNMDSNLGDEPAQANTALVVAVLVVLICACCGAGVVYRFFRKKAKEELENEVEIEEVQKKVPDERGLAVGSASSGGEAVFDLDNNANYVSVYKWTERLEDPDSDHHIEGVFLSGLRMQCEEPPMMMKAPSVSSPPTEELGFQVQPSPPPVERD